MSKFSDLDSLSLIVGLVSVTENSGEEMMNNENTCLHTKHSTPIPHTISEKVKLKRKTK